MELYDYFYGKQTPNIGPELSFHIDHLTRISFLIPGTDVMQHSLRIGRKIGFSLNY